MKMSNSMREQAKKKACRYHGAGSARKTAAGFAAVLLAAVLLFGTAAGEEYPLKLMIVSDLHYLSPSLYENSEGTFESALKKGDGKMTQYSRELLEGLIQEVRHQRPDALIISGDLSFNGEKASHLELAEAFEKIRADGTDVWVIPGNHDINYPYAAEYTGKGYKHTANVTPGEFMEIYSASMIRNQDGESHMSYAVPLNGRVRLAMCDVCVYRPAPASGGFYSEETAAWLQKVLEEAKTAGEQVITVTHQSLIPHTEFLLSSMAIGNRERMAQQMRASGNARLNLSGHLHIQHISGDDGIYDIATGAWSVPPFRYGLLMIREDGSAAYEAGALCREHLPRDMARRADTWFENIVTEKERPALEALGIPEKDLEPMLNYAARLNHAYFSGDFVSSDAGWTEDPAFKLWMKIRDRDSFAGYLTELATAPENRLSALKLSLPGKD